MAKTSLYGLVGSILIAACVTTSLPVADLNPVPSTRVYWQVSEAPDSGTLLVARDRGFTGSIATAVVELNGQPAGDIRSKEFLTLNVPAGSHSLAAWIRDPGGHELMTRQTIDLFVGKAEVVLIRIGFADPWGMQRFSLWQDSTSVSRIDVESK